MKSSAEICNYPITLNLHGRLVVVVGAGNVGRRKVKNLLQAGARVRLIDPVLGQAPYPDSAVESVGRTFQADDLQSAQLVFACTDSSSVNQQVLEQAHRQQLFCCRADQPGGSDFALPAVMRRGSLTLSVSTGGGSPALAAELRDRLVGLVPASWAFSLEVLAAVRQKLLTEQNADKYNQQVLRGFFLDRLLSLAEQGKISEIDQLLKERFGSDYSLERLETELPEGIL